jgi:hypothetical protein
MSLFNKKMMDGVENQRLKMKTNMEEFQKARENLPEDQLDEVKTEFQKHYLKQIQKDMTDREVFEKDGVHYIVFETPDKKIEFDSGGDNKPKEFTNNDKVSWRMTVNFPLMTPDEASFPTRMAIFISDELLKEVFKDEGYWKMLIGARGRLSIEYQNISDYIIELDGEEVTVQKAKYAEKLEKFLKRNYIDNLTQIDESDYVKRYTFNLSQVLDKVKLK